MKKLLILLAFGLSTFITLKAQNHLFVPPLPEMNFAQMVDRSKFNGDRWSFMEAGDPAKPTIVCMHGLGGSSVDWLYQLNELSENYHVVAWNAPGYMLSDEFKTDNPVCVDFADALADFLNALKIEKVYLLGNSFGSIVAQCFAMNYPDRVLKVILVGPLAGLNVSQEVKANMIAMRQNQIKDGGYSFTNKRVEALLAPNPSPELVAVVRKGMMGTHPRAFMSSFFFALAEDHALDLVAAKVKSPVLLIAGKEDKITPINLHAEPLQKSLSNARLEILEGVGHLPHIEAPQKVNKLIRDFFGVQKPIYANKFNLNDYKLSVYKTIDSLMNYGERTILAQDTVSMRKFVPEDLVITNPFGQMIGKEKMIERVKAGIIKYSKFEKTIEHFAMESDKMAVVAGKEVVTPTTDANRADAGKLHERRFTEVWVLREGNWVRIIRHASNI
jgi:pimeloyl-ACP methyl ester carboxylesterase